MRRRGLMGASGGRLPIEYQEVEWIASSSGQGQYINTLIIPTNNTGMKLDAVIPTFNDTNFLGCRTDSQRFVFNGTGNRYGYGWGAYIATQVIFQNGIYQAELNYKNSRYFICDNSSFALPNVDFQINCPIFIFGQNRYTGAVDFYTYTVKNFCISEEYTDIRHFIPCYRKSDNKPGMYDICESICPLTGTPFYINANTSATTDFTVGPDVN